MKTKPETKEEDKSLEQINERINKRNAAQAAQERARADEAAEKARAIRAARKWRCVVNYALCAASGAAVIFLHTTGHISGVVASIAMGICLVCTGWHANELFRAFRRRG